MATFIPIMNMSNLYEIPGKRMKNQETVVFVCKQVQKKRTRRSEKINEVAKVTYNKVHTETTVKGLMSQFAENTSQSGSVHFYICK